MEDSSKAEDATYANRCRPVEAKEEDDEHAVTDIPPQGPKLQDNNSKIDSKNSAIFHVSTAEPAETLITKDTTNNTGRHRKHRSKQPPTTTHKDDIPEDYNNAQSQGTDNISGKELSSEMNPGTAPANKPPFKGKEQVKDSSPSASKIQQSPQMVFKCPQQGERTTSPKIQILIQGLNPSAPTQSPISVSIDLPTTGYAATTTGVSGFTCSNREAAKKVSTQTLVPPQNPDPIPNNESPNVGSKPDSATKENQIHPTSQRNQKPKKKTRKEQQENNGKPKDSTRRKEKDFVLAKTKQQTRTKNLLDPPTKRKNENSNFQKDYTKHESGKTDANTSADPLPKVVDPLDHGHHKSKPHKTTDLSVTSIFKGEIGQEEHEEVHPKSHATPPKPKKHSAQDSITDTENWVEKAAEETHHHHQHHHHHHHHSPEMGSSGHKHHEHSRHTPTHSNKVPKTTGRGSSAIEIANDPYHLAPETRQEAQVSLKAEFSKVLSRKLPMIWVFGYPQMSISSIIDSVISSISEAFEFFPIHLEREIPRWLDNHNAGGSSEDADPAATLLQSSISGYARTIISPIGSVSFPGLAIDDILELIQLSMTSALQRDSRIQGFIIRSFPTNVQEATEFEKHFRMRAPLGLYFLNEEWTSVQMSCDPTTRVRVTPPHTLSPKYFLRKYQYTEWTVAEAVEAYKLKVLKITNAEALVGPKVQQIVDIVGERLQLRNGSDSVTSVESSRDYTEAFY